MSEVIKKKRRWFGVLIILAVFFFCGETVKAEMQVFVNDQKVENYYIKDGKTYVELRELSEKSKESLVYDKNTNQVKYNSSDEILPIKVDYTDIGNRKGITKTYKVPQIAEDTISKSNFIYEGYEYQMVDFKKEKEMLSQEKEASKNINITVPRNNVDYIMSRLDSTMEYGDDEGYKGTLKLDPSSIESDVAGYKQSSYTKTETRTYPNLSDMDISVVPKSITVSGVRCNLVDVAWQESFTDSADYEEISKSYTAVVKYSGTGSTSNISGYSVSARYIGVVKKEVPGDTFITVMYDGALIQDKSSAQPQEPTKEHNEKQVDEEMVTNNTSESNNSGQKEEKNMMNLSQIGKVAVPLLGATGLLIGVGGLGYLLLKKNKNEE